MTSRINIVTMAIALTITLVVGGVVAGEMAGAVDERYFEAAETWCEEEFGPDAELYNAQVIGPHGGLHCEAPDGTTVHISEVPKDELYAALPDDDD